MTVSIVLGPINRGGTTAQFSATAEELLNNLDPWTVQVNALEVNVNAKEVSAVAAAAAALVSQTNAATSASLAATYAGATAWVSGGARTIGDKKWSLVNGFTYRARTTGTGGVTDPASDATNWELWSTAVPVQLITGLVQEMVSGAAYAATNTTAQAAATSIGLWSEDFTQWTQTGSGSVSPNNAMDPNGNMKADTLSDSDAGADACHFSRTSTVPNDSASYVTSGHVKQGTAAATFINAYFTGGTTVTAGVTITWGTTPVISALGVATSPVLTPIGNGWYRASFVSANNSSGNTTRQTRVYPAGSNAAVTGTVIAWGFNSVAGSAVSSYIPTDGAAVTRPAGVVEPTRFILPPNPTANAWCRTVVSNAILTNIVDPNGQTLEGNAGPLMLELGQSANWQFINNTWKRV